MKSEIIYNRFASLFTNPNPIERTTSFEDDLYAQADDKFIENADIIEHEFPELAAEDCDSEKWYDEYHDEVVQKYCQIIIAACK